jgi:hypothetical protein
MPTIYTSIPLPAPHKLWFSAESNRHYAYSCMYTLCPSLNFSQLAALSFSVSFRFGLPLPPDRHDLLISGDDASTIQRLVPGFSLLKSADSELFRVHTWYDSVLAFPSPASASPDRSLAPTPHTADADSVAPTPESISVNAASVTHSVSHSPAPSIHCSRHRSRHRSQRRDRHRARTPSVSLSPPASLSPSVSPSLAPFTDSKRAHSRPAAACAPIASTTQPTPAPAPVCPSTTAAADPGWETVTHRKIKRKPVPDVQSCPGSPADMRLRRQCIKTHIRARDMDPFGELVGLPDSHPIIQDLLRIHGFKPIP